MKYSIKNWQKFQHYKDRKPLWIKLYRDVLDSMDWSAISGLAAKHLIMIWLIGSEYDGELPDIKVLAFRLRTTIRELEASIKELCEFEFLIAKDGEDGEEETQVLDSLEQSATNLEHLAPNPEQLDTEEKKLCSLEKRREEKEKRKKREREREEEQTGEPSVSPSVVDAYQPEIIFICKNNPKTWTLTNSFLAKAQKIFPNLDLLAQIRLAKDWTERDERNPKTAKRMEQFLLSWFGRANQFKVPGGPQKKTFDVDEFLRAKFAEVQP